VPQQQRNWNKARKRPAKNKLAVVAAVFVMAAAVFGTGPWKAPAMAKPAPNAGAAALPLGTSLFFVLDGTINSQSAKPGSTVRAHLRTALTLGGRTIAPAGTPVVLRINQVQPAEMANQDASVDIYFEPLLLPDGKQLPLITPTGHIDPHLSVGQANTRGVTDTVGDIFIPYHYMYHILRKGLSVDMRPGTVIRARTGATLRMEGGVLAIATPAPFIMAPDTPHPAFSPAPIYTPPGFRLPTPKPSPSAAPPKPQPTITP
jgi:hypothetical protein